MNNFSPLVSIVMPVYNGSNYLKEAVDSALSQTYENIEVIVVNDGSTDNGETEKIALSYGDKIRYFSNKNGGVASALNFGIEKMNGEYFSWLSHDDMYKSEKIEKEIEILKTHGKPAIVFCNFDLISEDASYITTISKIDRHCNKACDLNFVLKFNNIFHGCTLLIPKDFFIKYGLFDKFLHYTQDYEMWLRFAQKETFLYLDESLVLSRQHELQDSVAKKESMKSELELILSQRLSGISKDEIIEHIKDPMLFLIEGYVGWINMGYIKTSTYLLKHIFDINKENPDKRACELLDSYVFKTNKQEKFEEVLKTCENIASDNSKKKIIIFNNVWVRGGVERVLSIFFEHLTKKYTVIFITTDEKHENEFDMSENVIHLRIPPSEGRELLWRLSALCLFLQADLFIATPNYISSFIEIYKFLNELNIKSIAWNHCSYFFPYQLSVLNELIEKRIDCLSYATVAIWLTSFSTFAYSAQNNNSFCISNPQTFDVSEKSANFGKTIIAVGRFNDSLKRLDLILKTFKVLLKKEPNAKLLLVGPYNKALTFPPYHTETIEELLKELDFNDDSITFIGESECVDKYYLESSVMLMPSESEGLPMVLLEAGAFGLPCIISDIAGLEDVITDGENGFIVPLENTEKMAEKLHLLLSNEELYAKLSKNSKEMVQRFSKENFFKRWDFLLNLIETKNEQTEINKALSYETSHKLNNGNLIRILKEYEKRASELSRNCLINQQEKNKLLQEKNNLLQKTELIKQQLNAELQNQMTSIIILQEEIKRLAFPKFLHIFVIPLYLIRDLFKSLREDSFSVTCEKILKKLRLKR